MSTFSAFYLSFASILFIAFSIVAYFVDLAVNKIGIMCIFLFWDLKFFVCGSFYGLEKWHFKGNLIPPLFCKSPNLWVAFALSEEYWVLFNILQSSCQVSILRTYNVDKIIITNLPLTIKGVSHNFCCCLGGSVYGFSMLISPEGIAQPRSQGSLLPAPWSEGGRREPWERGWV